MARPQKVILTLDRADAIWTINALKRLRDASFDKAKEASSTVARQSYDEEGKRAHEIQEAIDSQVYPEKHSTDPDWPGDYPVSDRQEDMKYRK